MKIHSWIGSPEARVGQMLKAVSHPDPPCNLPVHAGIRCEVEITSKVQGAKGMPAERGRADATFEPDRHVPPAKCQTRSQAGHECVLSVSAQPTGGDNQLAVHTPAVVPLPLPGQFPASKNLGQFDVLTALLPCEASADSGGGRRPISRLANQPRGCEHQANHTLNQCLHDSLYGRRFFRLRPRPVNPTGCETGVTRLSSQPIQRSAPEMSRRIAVWPADVQLRGKRGLFVWPTGGNAVGRHAARVLRPSS